MFSKTRQSYHDIKITFYNIKWLQVITSGFKKYFFCICWIIFKISFIRKKNEESGRAQNWSSYFLSLHQLLFWFLKKFTNVSGNSDILFFPQSNCEGFLNRFLHFCPGLTMSFHSITFNCGSWLIVLTFMVILRRQWVFQSHVNVSEHPVVIN